MNKTAIPRAFTGAGWGNSRAATIRMYNGTIVPNTGDDVLRYMSAGVLSPKGQDAHDYAWAAQ